ncbi:MAG: tetratricopeptide repeat protein [Acidobacteria bacterium]|nr:tetratricopeptide repeat protein [Acidobacteriota bacterium]
MRTKATIRLRQTTCALLLLAVASLNFNAARAQTRKPRAAVKKSTAQPKKTATSTTTKTTAALTAKTGAQARTTGANIAALPAKSLVVASAPNAVVWLDDVRRGLTDEKGEIELNSVTRAAHVLRVRAKGLAESVVVLTAAQVASGRASVPVTRPADEAERAFQDAEEARDKATDESRKSAVELYRRALSLRPRYAAAHVGLARTLAELGDFNAALAEVEAARDARAPRAYPEASAVEGRIHHSAGDDAAALSAYRRAIQEARGFQPEAHTGVGIVLQEKGDYAGAAAEFSKAVAQLSDSEPVLYQLLGEAYEKQEKYKEAVAAYEKYLQLAPTGKLAPAIESIIEQLRKQAAEQGEPPPDD